MAEIKQAHTSATLMAHQIPSTSKKTGRIRTEEVWKIRVRKKEIAADTAPLFKAVKKEEEKIFRPARRKGQENSRNAWLVKVNSSLSYPTKIEARGPASENARILRAIPEPLMSNVLFFSILLSSEWFPAP